MPYADRTALAAYMPAGYGSFTDDQVDALLAVAARDVDTLLAPVSARQPDGSKLDPASDLTADQVVALSRATCAQAEYRLAMGDDFFIRDQYGYVAGPDFQRRGSLARIGPKVLGELADCGLQMAVPIAAT